MKQIRAGIANAVTAICDPHNFDHDERPLSYFRHPSTLERVTKILLVNPTIRERLACRKQPAFPYCGE